jgi:isochorismate pyruvate lyase
MPFREHYIMAADTDKTGANAETEGDWRKVKSLAEVRANIDRLDTQIVQLLCERHHFVTAAAQFKPSVEGVVVPARVEEIIRRVRELAKANDVNPDTMEKVYRDMIATFTLEEQAHWRNRNK